MKVGEVRFLQNGEELILPKWVGYLPIKWKERYILKKQPYYWEKKEDNVLSAVLSLQAGEGLPLAWREVAVQLLQTMRAEGVGVVVAPYEGEFPEQILPFTYGKKLTALFAFRGVAEALRRQGVRAEEAKFLIAGADDKMLPLVLAGIGDFVNHLSFFLPNGEDLSEITEYLLEERGLVAEVFHSPNHTLLKEADVVLFCGMEQVGYEHILKRYAVCVDVVGNRVAFRRLYQCRWDVVAIDSFVFENEYGQQESRLAEAFLFRDNAMFRQLWGLDGLDFASKTELATKLQEEMQVKGFYSFGKRLKIAKKQG